MKVVINKCYGGFQLSKKAYEELGLEWDGYGFAYDNDRANPKLVEVIERLGSAGSGMLGSLKVVEIPDDIEWEIKDYDGIETIHEKHRAWS